MYYVLRARKGVPGIGRKIAKALRAQEITARNNPKPALQEGAIIINYGMSAVPAWLQHPNISIFLNHPFAVGDAVNKLNTLRLLTEAEIPTLEWTVDRLGAVEWQRDGHRVFGRETVTGKKGNGIRIFEVNDPILQGLPLYTKRFPKTHEFRVHVAQGQIIDYRQKKKRSAESLRKWGLEHEDRDIRSRGRGWAFAKNNIFQFKEIEDLAIRATRAIGLDFAGVDVLAKIKRGKLVSCVVCEVNSAPGMSDPRTLKAYVDYFKSVGV